MRAKEGNVGCVGELDQEREGEWGKGEGRRKTREGRVEREGRLERGRGGGCPMSGPVYSASTDGRLRPVRRFAKLPAPATSCGTGDAASEGAASDGAGSEGAASVSEGCS